MMPAYSGPAPTMQRLCNVTKAETHIICGDTAASCTSVHDVKLHFVFRKVQHTHTPCCESHLLSQSVAKLMTVSAHRINYKCDTSVRHIEVWAVAAGRPLQQ